MFVRWSTVARIWRESGPFGFSKEAWRYLSGLWRFLQAARVADSMAEPGRWVDLVAPLAGPPPFPIYCNQKRSEIGEFFEAARAVRPSTVVEIGTACGGTLFLLSRAASDDATLISIDLPGGEFGGGYSRLRAAVFRRFARHGQSIVLLRADSKAPETVSHVRRVLAGRRIELLFIDGDHTLAGVTADWDNYSPLVAESGIIALHDIIPDPGQPRMEVAELWARLVESENVSALVDDPQQHGFGIGIVTRVASVPPH